MNGTFEKMDWKTVGEALDMRVDPCGRGVVTLCVEPAGPRLVVGDNGGEFNTTVIEPDGTRWEPDFSVAYEAQDGPIGPITLAYRVACHAQDRQIDYRVDLDRWPVDLARVAALRALADQVEKDAERTERAPRGDDLALLVDLWKPDASRLTFERALRRGMGLAAEEYAPNRRQRLGVGAPSPVLCPRARDRRGTCRRRAERRREPGVADGVEAGADNSGVGAPRRCGMRAGRFASARVDGAAVSPHLTAPDLEAVVASARVDAQRHVAAWRTGYEESLEVSVSWHLRSRELGLEASLRGLYTATLAAEARRLHAKLLVRAAATAVDWAHSSEDAADDGRHPPDRTFLASQWGIVAGEIGVQADNEVLRAAFEQLTGVAVARELAYVGIARRVAELGRAELDI